MLWEYDLSSEKTLKVKKNSNIFLGIYQKCICFVLYSSTNIGYQWFANGILVHVPNQIYLLL